jgi:hypothetical protein
VRRRAGRVGRLPFGLFGRLYSRDSGQIPYYLQADLRVSIAKLRDIKKRHHIVRKVEIEHKPAHDCIGPGHPICDNRLSWTGKVQITRLR